MSWSARPTIAPGEYPRGSELEAILDQIQFLTDPPRAQLRQTTLQTVATATFTPVTFTTEDWDNYSGHSTTTDTSRYTAVVAGIYRLSGKVGWAANATGRRVSAWYKNGLQVEGTQVANAATAASDTEQLAVTVEVSLAVGDYVELHCYQESGGNLNTIVTFSGQQSLMTVRWVGED